jgi:hypothetical protein
MNIAKQKTIMDLRQEAERLEQEFREKKGATHIETSTRLISQAVIDLVEYLKQQGFEIDQTEKEKGQLVARLDGIWVSLTFKPTILSVHMVNGENYSVMVESTVEPISGTYKSHQNQDTELASLNNRISNVNKSIKDLDNQEFRYVLNQENNSIRGMDYNKQVFRNFNDVINAMFS